MTYLLNADGWFESAAQYTIRPRKSNVPKVVDGKPVLDKKGKPVLVQEGAVFTPVEHGLHPYIKTTYGTIRAVTIHCTDVICDAAALARSTASSSPRQSSYNLLIGLQGDLHQLASVFDRTWHAGRGTESALYREKARTEQKGVFSGPRGPLYQAQMGWLWPVVDQKVVVNPNNWGPGIEIMGKPGEPTGPQKHTLTEVLRELYAKTKVTPDTVWAHGDLDPLHRTDPGFDVAAFAAGVHPSALEARETDGWDGRGAPREPASGPGEHP
jgi:hypothetical protein